MKCNFVLNRKLIDKIEEIDIDNITFEDVNLHYGTGRSITHGSGRDRTHTYRSGVATNVGDIEEGVWREVIKRLIVRNNEQALYSALKKWCNETDDGQTHRQKEHDALQLHAARIFDNPRWVDFIPFNKRFRPKILENNPLVTVVCSCCEKSGQTTKEQIEQAYNHCICCPSCGRFSTFTII